MMRMNLKLVNREGAKSAKKMKKRLNIKALLAVSCLSFVVGLPCIAADEESDLDKGMLIDSLAQEGMSELLLHLVDTEKADDPVLNKQVEIAGLRIDYQRLLVESGQLARTNPVRAEEVRDQATRAYHRMVEAMRELIRTYYDHDQRPIWQTDLAQSLILDDLYSLNQSAPLFADFGVTTREQREALARAAPEALELLVDAQLRLFNLRGEVGRDPQRSQQLQSSGLFFRLFDEYDQRRTPYFLANAAYLVAQLPSDSPYYTDPDATSIPHRETDTDEEKERLLTLADSELKKVTAKLTNSLNIRDASTVLQGRVYLARGRYADALGAVEEIAQSSQRNLHWLTARLIQAATTQRQGKPDQALLMLDELMKEPAVVADLRYSLLVTDLTHRVLRDEADLLPPTHRDEAITRSYQPYLDLLSGPLTGTQSQGLRDFIYRRWEASIAEDEHMSDTLPAIVRLAISQVIRQQAQATIDRLESGDIEPGTDTVALRSEARAKFNEAIRLAKSLIGEDVPSEIRSEAMFNLALAMHGKDPNNTSNRLDLTAILTDLADDMPSEPVAEDAISGAVGLLRELHQVIPTPPGVEKAYERAVQVLFSKFPTSEAADNERLYYGYAVLAQSGRYREAVDMYKRVPFDHDDYYPAQRQAMLSLLAYEREADATAKPRILRELDALMSRVQAEAARDRESRVNPDRAMTARRAEATVRLVHADLAMDSGDYNKAIEQLDGFEADYPDQPDLIAESLEHRVIALGDSGRHEDLAKAAQLMVQDFPDQAAPVIDQVLTKVEKRIERLQIESAEASATKQAALKKQADEQAKAAAVLSRYLLEWAGKQDYDTETMMPFEVIRAKTLRLSGKADEAYPILARLIQAFPNDAEVMLQYAEVLYAKGDDDSLVESVRYYDRLITGLGAPYPEEWWIAWMRRLQINDRLGEGTEEIPLRVRQLRMTNPDLGGPITKMELERLERKYGR